MAIGVYHLAQIINKPHFSGSLAPEVSFQHPKYKEVWGQFLMKLSSYFSTLSSLIEISSKKLRKDKLEWNMRREKSTKWSASYMNLNSVSNKNNKMGMLNKGVAKILWHNRHWDSKVNYLPRFWAYLNLTHTILIEAFYKIGCMHIKEHTYIEEFWN